MSVNNGPGSPNALSKILRFLKRSQAAYLAIGTAVFVLSYSNCSPVEFDALTRAEQVNQTPPGGDGGSDPDPDLEEVQKACNGLVATRTVSVSFPNPDRNCAWGSNGNGVETEGHLTARTEQVVNFQLPEGSKICDMQFRFSEQRMRYDDHIILAFDNAVLASSHPFKHVFSNVSGIYNYEWSAMNGIRMIDNSTQFIYCLGGEENMSECQWPKTETVGTIAMAFEPVILQKITAQNPNRTNHEFKFITVGDNNPAIDCRHEPISFNVGVTYTSTR